MKMINQMKKYGPSAVFATAVTFPVFAMAADTDPATVAAEKIGGLITGVGTVGAAILGLTLAAVGFFVIRNMARRAA